MKAVGEGRLPTVHKHLPINFSYRSRDEFEVMTHRAEYPLNQGNPMGPIEDFMRPCIRCVAILSKDLDQDIVQAVCRAVTEYQFSYDFSLVFRYVPMVCIP